MPTKTKPFKLTMTAGRWGMITFDISKAEERALAKEVNEFVSKAFTDAQLEALGDEDFFKKVAEIYDTICELKGPHDAGIGDTEGRYGMCDAAVQYLDAVGHRQRADLLRNTDFLLFRC